MTNAIFYVKKKTLLLIASLIWLLAGFNVLRLGIVAYQELDKLELRYLFLSAIVACAFGTMFYKMAYKHLIRIQAYQSEKVGFWHFFDLKSYFIMLFMMSMGIYLRVTHLVPSSFIAFFYSGIGLALILAGVLFGKFYLTVDISKSLT